MRLFFILSIFLVLLLSIKTVKGQEFKELINKESLKKEKYLKKAIFAPGEIYKNGDTIQSEILVFKGRVWKNAYLFCICKSYDNSITFHSAYEIDGYQIDGTRFKSHSNDDKSYFIKCIRDGKVNLYERGKIPFDNKSLYYLQMPNFKELLIINPLAPNIVEHRMGNIRQQGKTVTVYSSNNLEEKFLFFVQTYLSDCSSLNNLIKSGLYNINDLPKIIDLYNNCEK